MLSANTHRVQKTTLVIEILRELDEDILGNFGKVLSIQICKPRDRGCGHHVDKAARYSRLVDACFSPDCSASNDIPCLLTELCSELAGQALTITSHGLQCGHVLGRQAHEVVFILRRLVEQASEWQIPIFVVVECDVCSCV